MIIIGVGFLIAESEVIPYWPVSKDPYNGFKNTLYIV